MERATCPRCGAAMASDVAHGLCPACLLKEGLQPLAECTSCHHTLSDDARFCPQCGAPAPAGSASAGEGDPIRRALDDKLRGQYRIVRLLGRGGMGAVYLARDLTLDREVAIKVISGISESREMYDRFRREARTAAKLSHPNIVPLHAFGEVEGMPYFVMGYVRGESLAARLRREGRLPEDEARRILAEIADALDHAHRQGVVHRDVKPDNVLLDDESGRALLTDFGVAKAVGQGETLTQHGSVVGTPHYMSPEQAAGRGDVDGRSDLYSLGVMGYAMLAGRLPFEGTTAAEVLTKHLTQEAPALRSLSDSVSDATARAVERCLAKDRAARWQDARSLKAALGATEEAQLPDHLEAVESHGATGVVIILGMFALLRALKVPWFVYPLNLGFMVTIYAMLLVRLRLAGSSVSESQRAIWKEPAWWLFWYPPSLRRRGNVWDRLPLLVRLLRWWPFLFAVYFFVLFSGTFPNLYRNPEVFILKILVGLGGILVLWTALTLAAERQLRKKGLSVPEARRVMFGVPPSRIAFWSRPQIAAVLAPAGARAGEARPATPHDQLMSILRDANDLGGPLRPLGAQAAVAARQLVEAIDHSDRRVADLVRSVEPGEEERLEEKIRVLGGEESAPLRTLLEKQLELIRGLGARIEEEKESRNRRVEMLRTLALHVASLRARVTGTTPTDVRFISDNVRALCDEIARQGTTPSTTAEEMPTVQR